LLLLAIAAPVAAQLPPCAIGESGPDCAPYRPPLSPLATPTPVNHATPTPDPTSTPAPINVVITSASTPAPTAPPVILLPETGDAALIPVLALFALAGLGLIAALRVLQGTWRVVLLLLTIACALGALWLIV